MTKTRGEPVVDLENGHGVPDSLALALVVRLQEQVPDAQVLLFGSRATLYHHLMPDSRPRRQHRADGP